MLARNSETLLNSLPDVGLCVVRAADHRLLYANQKAQRFSSALRPGQNCRLCLDCAKCPLDGRFQAGEVRRVQVKTRDRDMTALTASALLWNEHTPAYLLAFLTSPENDPAVQVAQAVSQEQCALRASLRRESALKSEIEDQSRFISNLSHDLRTPMNVILGLTAVAEAEVKNPGRVLDCLKKIQCSSQHLMELIDQVLDISRLEAGQLRLERRAFSLSELTERVLDMAQPLAEQQGLTLKAHPVRVRHELLMGDGVRLTQVLMNLLGNAVKYTPAGGQVGFALSELESLKPGVARFEFVVEDNGIGMSEEFLKQAFQPFSRALDERSGGVQGAGLGLAIARDIVRMMDGDIRVQSQVGKGSRFTVDLRMEIQRGHGLGDLHGQRALLVGLDAAQRQSLSEMLMQMGVAPQSVEAQEAVRAIDQTRERQSPYLAVILDGEGAEPLRMARKIRGRGAQPPLILLAGRAHAFPREEIESLDAQVIQKPVFRSRLEQALIDLSGRGEARAQSAKEKFRGRRVLLVEDNALNMEVAENLLRLSGLAVDRAFSGEEAVSMLERAAPGRYDLVFMDIRMPRMDGYQAAAAIRALGRGDLKSLPIIAMSASVMAKDVSKARSAGMNDHISKPVEMAILTGVLEKWLGKR